MRLQRDPLELVNEFRRAQRPWKVLSFASPQPTVAEPTQATTLEREPASANGAS